MKRIALVGGVVLALGFSSVALGDHSGSRDVFVGTCVGEGFVFYPTSDERLRRRPREIDVRVEADVDCTGELNGEPIEDSVVYLNASREDELFGIDGDGSDDEGRLDDLEGFLEFVGEDGEKLFIRQTSMNPQQTLVVEGRRKGEANGNIVPINGPRVIERADERPGARTVIFDIEFTTEPRGIVG